MEAMKQPPHQPLPLVKQVVFIYAGVNGYLDGFTPRKVRDFETQLYQAIDASYQDFVQLFESKKQLSPDIKQALDALLGDFKTRVKV